MRLMAEKSLMSEAGFQISREILKMQCDLLEEWFILVSANLRSFSPCLLVMGGYK